MMGAGRGFEVLIIGAGVVGTTMASLLVARRLVAAERIAVIAERLVPAALLPPLEWDLRVFAVSRASQRVLELCGTWAAMPAEKRHAYERMCVWDAGGTPGGAGSITFDAAELGQANLGCIVEGRALQAHALQCARDAGVVFIEAALEQVTTGTEGVQIRLDDGRHLDAQVVIAADGIESKTRTLLGIDTAGHAYHQDALVAHVRTALPHADTAWQRFTASGPLALLPLPDGRCSLVWSVARAEAVRLRKLDALAFGAALTAASGGVLGACELTTPLASFPLLLQYAVNYVQPRAVLLGDAAHVVHPLAGQGLNLGLLDCAALAEVWGQAGSTRGFGEQAVLRRYERWRRSENLLAATLLDGLERVFASSNPALVGLRGFGLSAAGRIPFVKREFAERALGLRGDVPAFLKEPWGSH